MMARGAILLWIAVAAAGCIEQRKAPPAAAAGGVARPEVMHVQLAVEPLGSLPNNGLLLPSVSPDGRWMACLQAPPDKPPDPASLLSGKGLQDMSLVVRDVARGLKARTICDGGACWASWSPDSRQLVFIAYREDRCQVGLHDLAAGQTRYLTLPLKTMLMPAMNPSLTQLALVGTTQKSDRLTVNVIDLATGKVRQSADDGSLWQLAPIWSGDRAVLYVSYQDGHAYVNRLAIGSPSERLIEVNAPRDPMEATQLFAGLSGPLSADGHSLACYDPVSDAICIIDLATRQKRLLEQGTRGGCWMGQTMFAAATDTSLLLLPDVAKPAGRLMQGQFLPRWASSDGAQLVACARGQRPWLFEIVRMRIKPQ